MTIGTDPLLKRNSLQKASSFLKDIAEFEKQRYFIEHRRPIYQRGNLINGELEYMITTNLDAGNYEGAFNTIEDIILGKQRCTRLVICYLFDIILRPSQVYEKLPPPTILSMAQKAQHMLFMILETFGATAFIDVWDLFDDGKRTSSRGRRTRKRVYALRLTDPEDVEEEEEEEVYQSSFTEFEHFQHLFASTVEYMDSFDGVKKHKPMERGPSMRAPAGYQRRKMVLDVLLSILEDDLYQTGGDPSALENCILVNKIINDHREILQWLNIIFKTMGADIGEFGLTNNQQQSTVNAEFGARMLNMLIAVSYCNMGAIDSKDLIFQSFRRLSTLGIDGCSNLMHMIKFSSYKFTLFDTLLSESNLVNIQQKYKSMRKQKLSIDFMDKFIKFDLNTTPAHLGGIQDVYRHVQIIVWKLVLGMDVRQIHYQQQQQRQHYHNGNSMMENVSTSTTASPTASMEDQVKETVIGVVEEVDVVAISRATMNLWKRHVKDMIKQVQDYDNYEIEQKVNWSISLVENIML